ncbi:cytochrome d ubiquinol oxidase subunit II [Halosquirtibacter xylanolyticus]|uniref:cytochrome d ubiquinol oxidase subunit II n=1 Tax=Halosquirtibacter xylanolyticus TaxID=3374599 RepID=UPI00374A2D1C|nr:cytochrome d ubiquinol oxidase subunit II [Prolixibacteraceae bacterium]
MDIQTVYFLLIGAIISAYAILDGYDLGVGAIYPFLKDDKQRSIAIEAIAPFWDGNEVWIVIAGGGLIAGFPDVYASVFSGFYVPVILLLFCLIFRAISIENRGHASSANSVLFWDIAFSVSSILIAFIFGLLVGNLMVGVPLLSNGNFEGGLLALFRPYPVIVGVLTVVLLSIHGIIFLLIKVPKDMISRLKKIHHRMLIVFSILFALLGGITYKYIPSAFLNYYYSPVLFLVPLMLFLFLWLELYSVKRSHYNISLLHSSITICLVLMIFAASLYPNIVVSSIDIEYSLNIYNASSSLFTLKILLIITVLAIPSVFAYLITRKKVFSGRIESTHFYEKEDNSI